MMRLNQLADFPPALRGGVLSIGNFDGVHAGHAAMLSAAQRTAQAQGCSLTIMTFDPHPSTLLRPDSPRPPLATLEQRCQWLSAFGPDVLLVIPTSREFLSQPADAFLREVVQGTLGAKHLVEGPNFTFGRGAKGTVATLQEQGSAYGFTATVVPAVQQSLSDRTLVQVSSSLIRWLVQQGRVADAARCLHRPFTLRGTVGKGQQRGRTIGFPTANLQTSQLLPAPGVYGGAAVLADGSRHVAAISVGTNPTFAGQLLTVEAYLLDFAGDLYDQTLDLEFHRWVRDQQTFAGVEPLKAQMQRDLQHIRASVTRDPLRF